LHGDVQPEHLLVGYNCHVTLIDLSLARRIHDDPMLESNALCGTPPYLAPELFTGRAPQTHSEIYSLGVLLFEMLAGQLPFSSSDLAALSSLKRLSALPDVRQFAPHVPREVSELIRALTARDPLRRPHPVGEVIERLLRLEIVTLRHWLSS